MPFVSSAQRAYMYANHPRLAARWQRETPSGKLPRHKKRRAVHQAVVDSRRMRGK